MKNIMLARELYTKHVVITQATRLASLRCLDMGFVPFEHASAVKLWGPAFLRRKVD